MFAAIVALAVPPIETKPFLAYLMLLVIVGGVGLACVKEGKVIDFHPSVQPIRATDSSRNRALRGVYGTV